MDGYKDNNFRTDNEVHSPSSAKLKKKSRDLGLGIVTLPPISTRNKKRVVHSKNVDVIQEKSEENEIIEKAIEDNIGQTGGSVNTILTKKKINLESFESEEFSDEIKSNDPDVDIEPNTTISQL